MPGNLGSASLKLTADGSQLAKDISKAEKSTTQKLAGVGAKLSKTLTPAVAAIGAAVFLATEEMDKAFGIIQTGTGASGKALEGLKADFTALNGSVNASSEEIATAIADVNTRLGLTGEALQEVARTALEGGIDINKFAQGMEIFGVETGDATGLMDKFFVISQDTGISIQDLTSQMQTFGPVLQERRVFCGGIGSILWATE